MTLEEWALIVSVVFSGMWSGLTAMLTTVIHPMLARMDGRDFARFLQAFLPTARTAPFNYAAILGMTIAPVVALFALDDASSGPFVLTAIGLGLTLAGPLLTSRLASEPHYDLMLAWDPNAMPADWEEQRRRYFTLNWIRGFATWAAFGLFLAALVTLL